MACVISAPNPNQLLGPVLPALPAASISKQPAVGILPLLSPILRQRVNILSSSSADPWLRLLCYDTANAAKLAEIVQGGTLEPHPVSGEVEVDWDYDAQTRYRRMDQETLQALVVLTDLGLAFQLVHCTGDQEGGGDGWRIGEVTVAAQPSPFAQFGGYPTIDEAERQFETGRAPAKTTTLNVEKPESRNESHQDDEDEDEDEDDDYWARYDATPARTPAQGRSPAPASMTTSKFESHAAATSGEDAYFAQYDNVQPAMDNHDPDEEAAAAAIAPPLGLGRVSSHNSNDAPSETNETQGTWTLAELDKSETNPSRDRDDEWRAAALLHPRPASSASSRSDTVAKLEATADKQEQNEFGVKQHISRSIRSLFQLSRASGIDREEFERLVRTELDVFAMVEDE